MQIHQISNNKKTRKRVGRGGKKGTYSGRGMKGQKARAGFSRRATFEGGSTGIVALSKKLRGFKSINAANQVISLKRINANFQSGDTVDAKSLKAKGLIRDSKIKIKILSDGELDKKINFVGVLASKKALEKIKKAGGEVKEAEKSAIKNLPKKQIKKQTRKDA